MFGGLFTGVLREDRYSSLFETGTNCEHHPGCKEERIVKKKKKGTPHTQNWSHVNTAVLLMLKENHKRVETLVFFYVNNDWRPSRVD